MIFISVYINKNNLEVVGEKEKQNKINKRAYELAEDNDFLRTFLNEHFACSELIDLGFKDAFYAYKDFLDECDKKAEKEFDECFMKRDLIIE